LPDENSDYGLPGRSEEANDAYFESSIESKPKNRILVITAISFVVLAAGIFSYYFVNPSQIDSEILETPL